MKRFGTCPKNDRETHRGNCPSRKIPEVTTVAKEYHSIRNPGLRWMVEGRAKSQKGNTYTRHNYESNGYLMFYVY